MKELEENNCEIRNVLKLKLPIWDLSSNLPSEEFVTSVVSKESKVEHTFGGFLGNDCKYAWMSCETHLAIIDIRYSKCISTWNFSHKVTSVAPFPSKAGQIPLLLVGLDNNAIRIKDSVGYLCIYDCCTSTIFTTIQVTAGVEKACVIHGGADWEEFNDIRPDSVLPENTGLIFAALRNLEHVIIDINRLLWENLFYEGRSITAKLDFVNISSCLSATPNRSKKGKLHSAFNLMSQEIEQFMGFDRVDFENEPLYDESLCSVLYSSQKTGLLITGCLGRVIIWQNNGSVSWISPLFDENSYVTHITLLEPSDDPRPFFYLWIASQSDASESSAVLRMFALLFEKKYTDKNTESSMYFNLESEPSLKFELELDQGERIHSLQAIERENLNSTDFSSRRGEDSLLLIGSNERILIFDLNRWYKEQMPRTMSECGNPNSVMASYRPKEEIDHKYPGLQICYIPRSLREFPTKGPSSPEELFYPNSLTFEWIEISIDSLTFWLARGVQSEILKDITLAGPILLTKPSETFRRCLVAGLVPFDSLPQDYSYDAEEEPQQREMLLTLCLEQRWANFLVRCAIEWSDGSAAFLYPEFLRWGVQRASELKLISDRLCVPLFDQSGTNIGEAEVKTLRFCAQQLECLTSVVSKLPNNEADIEKQRRALKRISTYLQVLLWFHDVGLLPENQELDEDETSQVSIKIPYPKENLMESYKKKRGLLKTVNGNGDDMMFIDQLINKNCQPLKAQWEREAGSDAQILGGCYPPPSLQSLLRSYLIDCYREEYEFSGNLNEYDQFEMNNKHSITIYLLMDLAMLLQVSYPSVDRLIKYPAAFKLSPSLIKLTQAFWLLDHDDFEGFFKIMTSQLILTSDIQIWHHKLAIETLLHNDQYKLALIYMRVLKPPLSSLDDQATLISLSVGQGLVETAFHARPPSHYAQLLTRFFQACKAHGKLKEVLYLSLDSEEEAAFVKFLEEGGCNDTRLLYYLQRNRHTEASDVYGWDKVLPTSRTSIAPKKINPTAIKMLGAFNATLPEITKCFANIQSKTLSMQKSLSSQPNLMDPHSMAPRAYPRPMSQCRDKLQEIYSLAINKTRETCLKTDRNIHTPNYLPFLGAPCSTIIYCTRVTGNTAPEQPEAVVVTFPNKRELRGKRSFETVHGSSDEATQSKRRKLSNETNDLSAGDTGARNFRRLSMSQVCCTPLVERKKLTYGKNADGIVAETPQSILKIRQMLGRSSNDFSFKHSDSFTERNCQKKNLAAGDSKPQRQIRFSMDRLSGTDGSISVEDSINYQNEDVSKNTEEESCVEKFYSPDVSMQSIRDTSILSDNSTKFIHGPRPRRSLKRNRRSSTVSDCQSSNSSSKNSTLDVSLTETPTEKIVKNQPFAVATSLRKSMLLSQTSLHCASILNPDSSAEDSFLQKPVRADSIDDNETESDVTDEDMSTTRIEKDEEVSAIDSGVVKDSYDDAHAPYTEDEELEEGELRDEEERVEDVEKHVTDTPTFCQISQNYEISDDEEATNEVDNKIEIAPPVHIDQELEISEDEKESEIDDNFPLSKNSSQSRKTHENKTSEEIVTEFLELESSEIEHPENYEVQHLEEITTEAKQLEHSKNIEEDQDHDDSFQSLSDSTSNFNDPSLKNADYPQHTSGFRFNFSANYSLTEKIPTTQVNESDQQYNHSLTKQLFLDSKGILRFTESMQDPVDITDDESQGDVEMEELIPSLIAEETEGNDITLNLSDGSDGEKNEVEKKEEQNLKNTSTLVESEPQNELSGINKKSESPSPRHDSSVTTLQQSPSPISSTKSDEFLTYDGHKRILCTSYKHVSPRRPIHGNKSASLSPKAVKSCDLTTNKLKENREKRSSSLTKEVKENVLETTAQATNPKLIEEKILMSDEKRSSLSSTSLEREFPLRGNLTTVDEVAEPSSQIIKHTPMDMDADELISLKPNQSCTLDTNKSIKKTRVESSVEEIDNAYDDVTTEKDSAIKEGKLRETRACSRAKDTSSLENKTRVVNKEGSEKEADSDNENVLEVKIAHESAKTESTELKVSNIVRKTRAASVALEEEGIFEEKMVSVMRRARGASVAKEESKVVEKTLPIANTEDFKTEQKDDSENKIPPTTRKTRAASVAKDNNDESSNTAKKTQTIPVTKEMNNLADETLHSTSRKTRATSVVKENDTEEKPVGRKTRAASVAKENEKPEELSIVRKTRATSVVKEDKPEDKSTTRKTRAASVAKEDDKIEEKSTSRKTRAASVAKDDKSEEKPVAKKTRAASVAKEDGSAEEKPVAKKTRAASSAAKEEEKPLARKTRAGSVAMEDSQVSEKSFVRKTRAASVAKEEENLEEKAPIVRRTRAGSTAKEEAAKKTRASSIAKDTTEEQDLSTSRVSGKRGNSVPKDVVTESIKPQSRTRRSTSLMKDVIPEESFSQLSPAPSISRRSKLFSNIDSPAVSSPAANTRSRRSSIQSVPEELEEVLSNVKSPNTKDESRIRRAISVDSNVILPPGKRLTRSRLAKNTLSEDVIPEDKVVDKKSTRRKREDSTDVDEKKESKQGKTAGRTKRGRKASETKDYEFSVPAATNDTDAPMKPGGS